MNKLKTLALLLFASTLTLTSCGDDDDDMTTPQLTGKEITFSGRLVTKVCLNAETSNFTDYMTDNTDVTVKMEEDASVTIIIKEMTGRPATGEKPASMMTDITFKKVIATRKDDGSYQFGINDEDFVGVAGGTMDGSFKPYRQGTLVGSFSGETIKLAVNDYKFSPSPYEPVMRSEFTGTIKK